MPQNQQDMQEIEVIPQPKFCGFVDTFPCCGQGKAQRAEDVYPDQLCFGIGGDRLICRNSVSDDESSSSGSISTDSFELPSVDIFEQEQDADEQVKLQSTTSFPDRFRQRVRRVRSAAPFYLI